MWESESWYQTVGNLVRGKRFNDSLAVHIDIFRLVAKHLGLRAEDELTKRWFAKSVGMNPMQIYDGTGHLIPFQRLVEMAEQTASLQAESVQPAETVAATMARPEDYYHERTRPYNPQFARGGKQRYKSHKPHYKAGKHSGPRQYPANIKCPLCNSTGHTADNCPYRKPKQNKRRPPKSTHDDTSVAQINAIGDNWDGLIHSEGHNGQNVFDVVLDCGATINCVNKEILNKLEGTMKPASKTIRVLRNVQEVKQCIEMKLRIGQKEDTITAYVVEGIPGEILIGNPFLLQHSEGLNQMIKEFDGHINFPNVCTVTDLDELQSVLKEFPDLILEDEEMPNPNRYFKGQTFYLGIPKEKRNVIYHRGQYQFDPALIEKYREIIEPLIKAGVLVRSNSPHNNPVILVPKKAPGKFRLVIDNRLVNAVCQPVGSMRASPLQVIRAINGAKIFTTIDCKNAFYSLSLAEEDRKYTSITIPGMGKFELTRMPMGAKASTAALYQAMITVLGDALYVYVLVWADDIIIFSKSMKEHVEHVRTILRRLDENGFCISRSKIELGQTEVKWLGYVISAEGIRPDPDKVNRLMSMRRPSDLKELKSAMGMWTYFTSFLPGYSIYAAPLFRQLKQSNTKLIWDAKSEEAWQTMKDKIAHAPIMGHIDLNKELFLHTDACSTGFAAMLTQIEGKRHILIDAASRTTNASEKNYPSIKLECACVIWATKKWKYYLYAVRHTTIITDSYGLQFLQKKETNTALVERWICEMENFQYTVQYRRGKDNIADFLSRQNDVPSTEAGKTVSQCVDPEELILALTRSQSDKFKGLTNAEAEKKLKRRRPRSKDSDAPVPPKKIRKLLPEVQVTEEPPVTQGPLIIDVDYIIERQKKDSYIRRIWKLACNKTIYQPTLQEVEDSKDLILINGVIAKHTVDKAGGVRNRIVVPLSMQKEVVWLTHARNAHPGRKGTLEILKQYHWFRGMKAMVLMVLKHCPECQFARGRPISLEKMSPDERPVRLGGRWHLDGVQVEPSGAYDHLIVAIDAATKYVILRPSAGETAQAASNTLLDIVRRFGRPREVTTDQGRAFKNEQFSKVCEGLLIKHKLVGVGQPQANGMVERANRTILDAAKMICRGIGRLWSKYVGEIEYTLNTRVSSVTGHAPYELVYGRLPPGPTYTDNIIGEEEDWKNEDNVRILRKRIEILQQLAHENQLKAGAQQRSYHDAHAEVHTFSVGDKVLVYRQSEANRGITSKLMYKWDGPYEIAQKLGTMTYTLKDVNGKILSRSYSSKFLYKVPGKLRLKESSPMTESPVTETPSSSNGGKV